MLVGARIIKTGIAVIFAIYISQWFHLDSGIGYIVASSVLAIQPSVYRSWRQLIENVEANSVGALFAIGGISLFGTRPAVIGLIIILVISINLRLRLERSLDLSIFVVIALAYSSQDHYLTYALHRFLFIMIGIGFATFINMFLLPPRHESRVMEGIQSTRERISLLLRLGSTREIADLRKSRVGLEQDIAKLTNLYRLYLEERPIFRVKTKVSQYRTKVVVREMMNILNGEIRLLEAIERFRRPHPEFAEHITHITTHHERLLKGFEGMVTFGLNPAAYHLIEENDAWIRGDEDEELLYAGWLARDLIRRLITLERLVYVSSRKIGKRRKIGIEK